MKLEDITKETLITARRLLAGSAIAAVAVFGVAACEDGAVDDPGVEVEDDGLDEDLDDGLDDEGEE